MTYPLGRLVEHDPRSRLFPAPSLAIKKPRSVLWRRYSPILDQGALGSCTGNAMTGWLGCAPHAADAADAARFDEDFAVALYSEATRIDRFPGEYPPDDTGSSGLAVAKAAQRGGHISHYSWCFTVNSLVNALQQQPVIVGVPWYERMFDPDSDGEILPGGDIVGGHEFLIRGVDLLRQLLLCDNSWGTGFGMNGKFTMSLQTWSVLRRQQADVTVPHV